jgi:hypothetical protein
MALSPQEADELRKQLQEIERLSRLLNKNIDTNCTTLPTDTRDMINTAINCNNMTDKVVMNNYVQNEVCSQIKNFPSTLPPKDEPINSSVTPVETNNKENQFFEYFVNGKNGLYPF